MKWGRVNGQLLLFSSGRRGGKGLCEAYGVGLELVVAVVEEERRSEASVMRFSSSLSLGMTCLEAIILSNSFYHSNLC